MPRRDPRNITPQMIGALETVERHENGVNTVAGKEYKGCYKELVHSTVAGGLRYRNLIEVVHREGGSYLTIVCYRLTDRGREVLANHRAAKAGDAACISR